MGGPGDCFGSPVLAVQGTLQAIWMAHETSRVQALASTSNYVSLGTAEENIDAGQRDLKHARPEWRLR